MVIWIHFFLFTYCSPLNMSENVSKIHISSQLDHLPPHSLQIYSRRFFMHLGVCIWVPLIKKKDARWEKEQNTCETKVKQVRNQTKPKPNRHHYKFGWLRFFSSSISLSFKSEQPFPSQCLSLSSTHHLSIHDMRDWKMRASSNYLHEVLMLSLAHILPWSRSL